MFWDCFSKVGLGPLVAVEGNMNAEKYIKLLTTTLIPELAAAGRPMTFMQDNAPCHTANVVKTFMAQNDIETLPWPEVLYLGTQNVKNSLLLALPKPNWLR
jgi:hypothetical protein